MNLNVNLDCRTCLLLIRNVTLTAHRSFVRHGIVRSSVEVLVLSKLLLATGPARRRQLPPVPTPCGYSWSLLDVEQAAIKQIAKE